MNDAQLYVNGLVYGGWKKIEVKRALDAVAGAFSLELTEKWVGQDNPWAIQPGDECRLTLGGQTIITGHVDSLALGYDKSGHAISLTGRDRTGDMVDCSAMNEPDQWTNITLLKLAQKLATPFGVSVTADSDTGAAFEMAKLEHGETAWAALERHCRQRGLLAISDAKGGIVLSQPGTRRAAVSLVQGENILSASGDIDYGDRFSQYTVKGQHDGAGDEWDAESSAHIQGAATDAAVKRYRPLLVVADGVTNNASAKTRAAWESTVRAGRSIKATVTVQGWLQQPGGALWDVNMLVPVRSSWLRMNGVMLIKAVTFTLDNGGGTITQLDLTSPSAWRPDTTPAKPKKAKGKADKPDMWESW